MTQETIAPSPEKASAVAQSFRLIRIGFLQLSAKLTSPPRGEGQLTYKEDPIGIVATYADGEVSGFLSYALKVCGRLDAEGEWFENAEISFAIKVDYAVLDEATVDDDGMLHFVGVSAFMHAFPYIRAEVQSLTTKLGFPALTLPLALSGSVPGRVELDSRLMRPPGTDGPERRKKSKAAGSRGTGKKSPRRK